MTIDTNTLKEHFSNMAIPTDKDFSNLIDLAETGQNTVGTNLIVQSDLKPGYIDTDGTVDTDDNGYNFYLDNYIATNGETTFTLSSPDYVFKGSYNDSLIMYDIDKNYLGYQRITSATQTLSKSNAVYIRVSISFVNEGGVPGNLSDWLAHHRYKLEKGSVATDYSVNPADILIKADSLQSTVTQLNSTDLNTILTAGFYQLNSGTNGMPNADAWTIYQVIPLGSLNGAQLAYGTNNTVLGMRSWNASGDTVTFTSWVQFADDSKVVHNTGNEEIGGQKTFDTAPIDKTTGNPYINKSDVTTAISAATATKADDTTVVHKTGANNFDTVPTYGTNNKPFAINDNGATSDRPTTGIYAGYQYYDTDLKKPIWYNGSAWTDSTGAKI